MGKKRKNKNSSRTDSEASASSDDELLLLESSILNKEQGKKNKEVSSAKPAKMDDTNALLKIIEQQRVQIDKLTYQIAKLTEQLSIALGNKSISQNKPANQPKKARLLNPAEKPPTFVSQNKFEILATPEQAEAEEPDEEEEENEEASTNMDLVGQEASATSSTAKASKVPPIHIRNKERWIEVERQLNHHGAKIIAARNLRDSIQIKVDSAESFRAATKKLDEMEVGYHTFALPEEKLVKAIIKGIPETIEVDAVTEELIQKGLPVVRITRMRSAKTKEFIPLLLVQLQRAGGAKIFAVTSLLSLRVTVEPQRRTRKIGQCFRCQGFGHSARFCHANAKCVKCAGDHLSYTCTKPRTEDATCANCGGKHPANYRGCPQFPKLQRQPERQQQQSSRQPQKKIEQKVKTTSNARTVQPGVSYAAATKGSRSAPKTSKTSSTTNGANTSLPVAVLELLLKEANQSPASPNNQSNKQMLELVLKLASHLIHNG